MRVSASPRHQPGRSGPHCPQIASGPQGHCPEGTPVLAADGKLAAHYLLIPYIQHPIHSEKFD